MSPKFTIPMSSPDLTEAERQAVSAVLQTPYLSMGRELEAFEAAFCNFTGSRSAIGVNSGTAGLHLCVRAAGITEGDIVITTPFSFVSSTNVLLFERAVPVFVDVEATTGNINVGQVNQAVKDITSGGTAAENWLPSSVTFDGARLKAILVVDVFGQPSDMDPILEIAEEHNLKVIEDSCEALGAEYKGRKAGTLGDYGVFGFYPNKQITTGEGGIIVTSDDRAASIMLALRNQGRAPGDTWLEHSYLGYNYRLDEMSAALGRVQLTRLDEMLAKRSQVAAWYENRLFEIPEVETPQVEKSTSRMSWFVYVIRLTLAVDRDYVVSELEKRGIPARPYFAPIHLQRYMVEQFGYKEGDYPVTEDLGHRSLALPFSGVMKETQVDFVCSAIREIIHQAGM
ncbi:MAG: DegT/DnrJ/EryC1/StrS family aminotransferase [Anaerolineales bacterium]